MDRVQKSGSEMRSVQAERSVEDVADPVLGRAREIVPRRTTRLNGEHLGGEEAQESIGSELAATRGKTTDSTDDKSLEVAVGSQPPSHHGTRRRDTWGEGDDKRREGRGGAVTLPGGRRGENSEGPQSCESGKLNRRSNGADVETARTPGSVLWMRPEVERSTRGDRDRHRRAEQTVEVVKTTRAEQGGVGRHRTCHTQAVETMEGRLFERFGRRGSGFICAQAG